MKNTRNAHKMLFGTPDGDRPLERSRCRWRLTLKCILKKCEGVGWIHVVQDKSPVVGYCEDGTEPSSSIKYKEFLQ
jgi:hypothetical protein